MPSSPLERRLVLGVLLLFLAPTVVVGAVLLLLYRQGVLESPSALALTVIVGFVAMMAYLGTMARSIGRVLVRTLQEIQLGTELMATVNPEHRLAVRTGDELESLAREVNRLADHAREARLGLEREVAGATEALAVERGKLAAVLETLGEGVVLATPEGGVTLANQAAQALLASGGASLLGRSLFDVVDREKVLHYLRRLQAAGAGPERFRLHPPTGAVLDAVMTPFADEAGRPAGFVLVLRDVTGPSRADDERGRLLSQGLGALRGPLASVRSLSESLKEDPTLPPGAPRRMLEAIHSEAVRLSRLVRELSEGDRGPLARSPWHPETISVADLAAMTLRRLPPDAAALVEAPAADGVAEPVRVRAEASALSAAQAHLVGAVLARAQPRRAWLRPGPRRGGVVQIEVGAAGQGMLDDLDARLDEAPRGGTGGSTVREVVRGHAGEVWAYAAGDRLGYRLTLPVDDPGQTPRPGSSEAHPWSRFVGAGLVSGVAAGGGTERPEFYDFSLLDALARQVPAAARERPLDALTYVVLDTETTGLAPERGDRVVSLAGVRVRGGAVRRGEVFDALVNPRRPIPAESVRLHGITDAAVADAPPIEVVLPAFLRFAEGAVLVGHQVWFDLRVLGIEAAGLGLPALTEAHAVLDTLPLSEAVHGPLPGHGLDTVAPRLGVAVRGRHSALGDALTTAEVFVRLVELLRKRGVLTLGQALDAARRARAAPGPSAGGAP